MNLFFEKLCETTAESVTMEDGLNARKFRRKVANKLLNILIVWENKVPTEQFETWHEFTMLLLKG